MGSVLRQMLSVKDISHEMDDLITCAVEFEAARSQRLQVSLRCIYLFYCTKYLINFLT